MPLESSQILPAGRRVPWWEDKKRRRRRTIGIEAREERGRDGIRIRFRGRGGRRMMLSREKDRKARLLEVTSG